jgi:hypothetical protein
MIIAAGNVQEATFGSGTGCSIWGVVQPAYLLIVVAASLEDTIQSPSRKARLKMPVTITMAAG